MATITQRITFERTITTDPPLTAGAALDAGLAAGVIVLDALGAPRTRSGRRAVWVPGTCGWQGVGLDDLEREGFVWTGG